MAEGGKSWLQTPPVFEKIVSLSKYPEFVVDTSVVFYLRRVGLLQGFIKNYKLFVPYIVVEEALRKDCGDRNYFKKFFSEDAEVIRLGDHFLHGEDAVLWVAEKRELPAIIDDKKAIKKAFRRSIIFTSSPMVPILLFLKGAISEGDMNDKIEEILNMGYYGKNVRNYMQKVTNIVRRESRR